MNRDRRVSILLALAATLALGACSAAGAGTSQGTGAEAIVPAVTLATSSPGAPADLPSDATGLFTGSSRCEETAQSLGPGADPNATYVTCEQTTSDPRLSGTSVGTTHWIVAGDQSYGLGYGEGELTNDTGSWQCSHFMMGSVKGGTGFQDTVCTGSGDYEGLSAYMHGISGDTAATHGIVGWVAPTP